MTKPGNSQAPAGRTIRETRIFTQEMFDDFARLSDDVNPIHLDPTFAAATRFGRPVAHGMFLYSVVCGVLSKYFPGATQLSQTMMFPNPTYAGEPVTIELEPGQQDAQGNQIVRLRLVSASGETTLEGETILQGARA